MFPAKIYIGQIAVVFGIVIASTWGATQWTAAALGFQERLGSPWFLIADYPVYLPWRLFEWWFAYEAYAPEIFEKGGAIAAAGGIAGRAAWTIHCGRCCATFRAPTLHRPCAVGTSRPHNGSCGGPGRASFRMPIE
jgi:type IV secretory pathway TraG/TraD family ATPase VirD4